MKGLRAALAILSWLVSANLCAHALSTAHVRVLDTVSTGLVVELDLALRDVELGLGIDADHDAQISWGELKASELALQAWVGGGLSLQRSGQLCSLAPQPLMVRRYADGSYAHVAMTARCASTTGVLQLRYQLLFDQDPGHRAVVAADLRGHADSVILSADRRTAIFDAQKGNSVFGTYVQEGVHHILIGYDHLAFLISLLLPLALVRRVGKAMRVASLTATLKKGALLVSAFTLAHSITLSLSALGWVVPASRPVEILIAASVVVAALNNIWLKVRRHWVLAISFGLIHGFGFAGALGELGLPSDARLLGLVAFNIGVELGQLAIAAAMLPLIHWLTRWRYYRPRVMVPVSALIAALGLWWLLQRVTA